jgi:hypothetical protein
MNKRTVVKLKVNGRHTCIALLEARIQPVNLCSRYGDQLFPDEILNADSFCALCDQIRSEALQILANKLSGAIDHHKKPLVLAKFKQTPLLG